MKIEAVGKVLLDSNRNKPQNKTIVFTLNNNLAKYLKNLLTVSVKGFLLPIIHRTINTVYESVFF